MKLYVELVYVNITIVAAKTTAGKRNPLTFITFLVAFLFSRSNSFSLGEVTHPLPG